MQLKLKMGPMYRVVHPAYLDVRNGTVKEHQRLKAGGNTPSTDPSSGVPHGWISGGQESSREEGRKSVGPRQNTGPQIKSIGETADKEQGKAEEPGKGTRGIGESWEVGETHLSVGDRELCSLAEGEQG